MSEENVISLAQHLRSKTPIETCQAQEIGVFSIAKEKTILRRVFAFASDFFIILMIKNLISISFAVAVNEYFAPLSAAQRAMLLKPNLYMEIGITLCIFWAYFFYCNYALGGKTLGSTLMKLNTIDAEYPFNMELKRHHPSASQAARRAGAYILCYASFGTFFFLALLDEEKKGVPDALSGTRVVSDEWLVAFKAYKEFGLEEVRIDVNSLNQAA